MKPKSQESEPLAFEPPETDDPQRRLVLSAIAQIEAHGVASLTVRGIAAAAGMNIASVNYYFRSKEALLAAALDGSIRNVVQDAAIYFDRFAEDPPTALTDLLTYFLEGARRYPRITKAQLYDAFTRDDYSGPFPTLFAPVISKLRDKVRTAVPGLVPADASRRVIAALSAVFFPACFPGLYLSLGTMESAEGRRAYADMVAKQTLAPPVSSPRKRMKSKA